MTEERSLLVCAVSMGKFIDGGIEPVIYMETQTCSRLNFHHKRSLLIGFAILEAAKAYPDHAYLSHRLLDYPLTTGPLKADQPVQA